MPAKVGVVEDLVRDSFNSCFPEFVNPRDLVRTFSDEFLVIALCVAVDRPWFFGRLSAVELVAEIAIVPLGVFGGDDQFESAVIGLGLEGLCSSYRMLDQGLRRPGQGGRLIAMASIASLKGGATIPAYAAAKHGVLGLVRSVAQEVAQKGITCNAVCPGFVETPLAEQAVSAVQGRFALSRDEAVAQLVADNPMKRMIDPAEVVAAVLFLASDGASMVNGHALSVSGGEI